MGGFVSDNYVSGLLDQLNLRFAPGDAIKEMVALQKEFDVFSEDHALWESFALLNIGRMESWRDRRGWYRYLTSLRDAPSDRKGVKAHDRIVAALQADLTMVEPLPVCFTAHSTARNPGVVIGMNKLALVYSTKRFLTISLPVTAVEKDRAIRRSGS